MPIPLFDGILNVLPPHLGKDGEVEDLSPYRCTMAEVCERFATTTTRVQILKGLLELREKLRGMTQDQGFQWFDGSFVEDIEVQENREPGDIDVVTFCFPDRHRLAKKLPDDQQMLVKSFIKTTYHVDHFWVPLDVHPVQLVEHAKYWYGFFSHRRDRTWKGMLQVDLSKTDDDAARSILGRKP